MKSQQSIKGVIFDLDGTLMSSQLNFAEIRSRIGCPAEQDLLQFVEQLSEPQRHKAQQVIIDFEMADAMQASWLPGVHQCLQSVVANGLPIGLVTRNCREATMTKLAGFEHYFDHILTREDAQPKPHPEALLKVAKYWSLPPQQLLYMGDYLYDLQAANNAQMGACLYAPGALPVFHHLADYIFQSFDQFQQWLVREKPEKT